MKTRCSICKSDFVPTFKQAKTCEPCLSRVVVDQLNAGVGSETLAGLIAMAKLYQNHNQLVENIDYTLENGNYVFSQWYHLKRGNCCGNGCRHCPYP